MAAFGCTGGTFSGGAGGAGGGAGESNAGSSGDAGGGDASGDPSAGSSGQTVNGGEGGHSGTSGQGGEGNHGLSGEAGARDHAGESGAGGEGSIEPACTDSASCGQGRYCSAQARCAPCTDLTSLDDPASARFTTPEPLSVLNDATSLHFIRFPRAFGSEAGLIYEREFFGRELWLTGNLESEVGAPLAGPIDDPDFDEGAALWLGTEGSGALASYNFVYNRAPSAGGPSELYAARVEANGTAPTIVRLPAPFNTNESTLESSFSMAVSARRAWWMVNRDGMLDVRFYTAPLDGSAPPSVVALRQKDACLMNEFDLAAWVTPDGKLLFVNAAERDANCTLLVNDTRDIVVFKLDDAGQALGNGSVLPDIHEPDVTEADASLSADMCWLFFTKMQDTGRLGVMRARRDG